MGAMKKLSKGFTAHIPSQGTTGTVYTRRNNPAPLLKKSLGQHFLRKESVVLNMIKQVTITKDTSVLEIGCGDGFLTQAILTTTPCKQVVCYEIDPEWATFVRNNITDPRLDIRLKNILEVNLAELTSQGPWVLLANIPYNITFPILSMLEKNRSIFQEIIIMVQEEVAQKIGSDYGRSLGTASFFYQHRFEVQLLEKIEPEAFTPPPNVFSRLLYLKPILNPVVIPEEDKFWKFLQLCFKSPRQTLRNNLRTTHYEMSLLEPSLLAMRSQQLDFATFLAIWDKFRS